MSDDTRIARLEQLACQVFSHPRWGRVTVSTADGGVDVLAESGGLLIGIQDHPHAFAAAEVALLVMLAKDRLDLAEALRGWADKQLARCACGAAIPHIEGRGTEAKLCAHCDEGRLGVVHISLSEEGASLIEQRREGGFLDLGSNQSQLSAIDAFPMREAVDD